MKKQVLLIIVLFCMYSLSFSQTPPGILWTKTYGGTSTDASRSVQQTNDGGYIIAGYTNSFGAGGYDVYLIKTDADGDTIWTKTYGGIDDEEGRSVQQTSDGGYVISGYTNSFGAGNDDVYLIKTDADGDTIWTSTYGGTNYEEGNSVQQTFDGGYIISGSIGSFPVNVYLVKTGPNGDFTWDQEYAAVFMKSGYCVQQTIPDNGYIIAGMNMGYSDPKVHLIKTDTGGVVSWARDYGGSDMNWGYAVQQTSGGGYIAAGYKQIHEPGPPDYYHHNGYLVKTNSSGDITWDNDYGKSKVGTEEYEEVFHSVQQIPQDGGYIAVGYTGSESGSNRNVYAVKTDADGDTIWTKNCGGTSAFSVQQTEDTGYIICGKSGNDVYLIKIGPEFMPISPVVTIEITGNNTVLTWDPVEISTTGNPITVDRYNIYYGDTPDPPFSYLSETADTTYTHTGGGAHNNKKFYQVTAVVE